MIRRATVDDAEEIARLYERSFVVHALDVPAERGRAALLRAAWTRGDRVHRRRRKREDADVRYEWKPSV
jgi:hypothetical protein